jgi:hypothetical protein
VIREVIREVIRDANGSLGWPKSIVILDLISKVHIPNY